MIKGIHGLFYSSNPEETRAFIRDKLQLPYTDTGGGWLIFDFQEGDLGVHPVEGAGAAAGHHDISFFTDDIEATVAELKSRGVELEHDVQDHGYGLVTHLMIPGGLRVQLYQPKYVKKAAARPKASRLVARAKAAATKVKAKVQARTARKKKPAARGPAAAKKSSARKRR